MILYYIWYMAIFKAYLMIPRFDTGLRCRCVSIIITDTQPTEEGE